MILGADGYIAIDYLATSCLADKSVLLLMLSMFFEM
jgi:hypothetical protein